MKTLVILVCLLGSATKVHAHVADMSAIIHVADHGWMGLAFLTLLLLLLPLLRWCREQSVGLIRLKRKIMGANQKRSLDEENSPAHLTSSINAVDRYPWICSQTALSSTDC